MDPLSPSRIWLSSPHMSGFEMKYVDHAFETNWIAPTGENVDSFEEELKIYTNSDSVAALNSGTAGLHLGLVLLGVKEDDFVLTQSLTFAASANPIRYQNATPVFIDSEWLTWNMCPFQLENAIKACLDGKVPLANGRKVAKLPKAIIVVHLYGMPANMDEILRVADKYGIAVLEDAAEALGSRYKGNKCGNLGKLGVISFNGNKIITTSAGGALISNDPDLIRRARFLASQSREDKVHYEHTVIGYNYRMSNILAGIGRGQLEVVDQRVNERRNNYEFYKSHFQFYKGISIHEEPSLDYFSNHWLTAIMIDPELTGGIDANYIRTRMNEVNIETRPIWKPMHLQPVFADFTMFGSGISDEIFAKGICLPSGSNLSKNDLNRIMEVFEDIFEENNLINNFPVHELSYDINSTIRHSA